MSGDQPRDAHTSEPASIERKDVATVAPVVRVLQRTAAPIRAVSSIRGMIAVVVLLIVTPATFVGYFAGAAIGIVVALAMVLILVLFAAVQLQRELDARDLAPRPHLRFHEPRVNEYVQLNDGTTAHFVVLTLSNDPPSHEQAETARHVHGLLNVFGPDGSLLYGKLPARWQDTEQAPVRSVYAPTATGELLDKDIPANGRDYVFDSVMKPNDPLSPFYVWNNDSTAGWEVKRHYFQIEEDEFEIELRAKGENTDWISQRVRVRNRMGFPKVEVTTSDRSTETEGESAQHRVTGTVDHELPRA